MRNSLLLSAALIGLTGASALAQLGAPTGATQSPPAPAAGSQMPQPTNSLPAGAPTAVQSTPGAPVGVTQVAPVPVPPPVVVAPMPPAALQAAPAVTPPAVAPPALPMVPQQANTPVPGPTPIQPIPGGVPGTRAAPSLPRGTLRPMIGEAGRGMTSAPSRRARLKRYPVAQQPPGTPAVDDGSAPPSAAYRGGVGSPGSTRASNITGADTRTVIAPRLPDPNATGTSMPALLQAAQRALARGQTGAAQEALERAETRALSRTVPPGMAGQPDQAAMVQHVAAARRALGNHDMRTARAEVDLALAAPVPPTGPAYDTVPAR